MRVISSITAAIGGLFLLALSPVQAASPAITVNAIRVPGWNIIADTLAGMATVVNGKRNDIIMQQTCNLAWGDSTQQEVNAALAKSNIDAEKIPLVGNSLSMLVNGDTLQQQIACTAWMSNSLFATPDSERYLEDAPATKDKPAKKVFSQTRFAEDTRASIAVARATAQLYAVIAENLQQQPATDWAGWQQRIKTIVAFYAPEYLKSIRTYHAADIGKPLITNSITGHGYDVSLTDGFRLVKNGADVTLLSRNVVWLGGGKILGQDFFFRVAIFAQPAVQESPKASKNKKK